jgi:hypothetical protein
MSLAFESLLPATKAEKFKTLAALFLTKQRSYTEQFHDFNSYRINQNNLTLCAFKAVCSPAQNSTSKLFYIYFFKTKFCSRNNVNCQFSKNV